MFEKTQEQIDDAVRDWQNKVYRIDHSVLDFPTRTFKRGEKVKGRAFEKLGATESSVRVYLKNNAISVHDGFADNDADDVDDKSKRDVEMNGPAAPVPVVLSATGGVSVETINDVETPGFQTVADEAAALVTSSTPRSTPARTR